MIALPHFTGKEHRRAPLHHAATIDCTSTEPTCAANTTPTKNINDVITTTARSPLLTALALATPRPHLQGVASFVQSWQLKCDPSPCSSEPLSPLIPPNITTTTSTTIPATTTTPPTSTTTTTTHMPPPRKAHTPLVPRRQSSGVELYHHARRLPRYSSGLIEHVCTGSVVFATPIATSDATHPNSRTSPGVEARVSHV